MSSYGWLIGFPLFIVAPCVISAWIGSRLRRPIAAFVLAWVLTPFANLAVLIVFWSVLRAITPPENDGTGAIMLPFLGVLTGLASGLTASVMVSRRMKA
jgi:hypothetical protein